MGEFSYSQQIKLFEGEDDCDKSLTFSMRVEESEYIDQVLPIIDDVFETIRDTFIDEYLVACEKNNRVAEIDFVDAQIEEVKVDFTYWVRSRIDKNKKL